MFLIVPGCTTPDTKLFWITNNQGHTNDFLFMAESTNISPLQDNLTHFLTMSELSHLDSIVYRDFGEIYDGKNFRIQVLLKNGTKAGRDYTFILRTFNPDYSSG